MSVDYRTRKPENVTDVCINTFFTTTFPALLEGAEKYLQPWLSERAPGDCSIDCEGKQWQLGITGHAIGVRSGTADSGLLVKLTADEFSGLVNDLYTPMTFFTGGTLNIQRGDLSNFLDWWLVLRAIIDRRPIHSGAMAFEALDGSPLDLSQSFSLDSPLQDMRQFLQSAGFLHIQGVFSEEEMADVSTDIDRYRGDYTEGDGKSWWASTADGERLAVRLQSFDERSAATARLLEDPRFQLLGDITGDNHSHAGLSDNAIEALIKPLHVVKGISDLPWHKDCSLGRHSYECCSLTVGISVTGADAQSGQLRVIAGSHRALMWPALLAQPEEWGLPIIDLPTRTGDLTLHLSCTHHMAQAPSERERRVMYTSFRLPSVAIDLDDPARRRLYEAREAAYRNVSQ
ncbi:Uncharacterised protein [Halioglobus japonicus]|nr:Uncharacterised protein [Halioglobus japonicus]